MKALVNLEIADHQSEVPIPNAWLDILQRAGLAAWPEVVKAASTKRPCFDGEWIDIAFVSTDASDRTHQQFMGISGATDVITFLHGELVICPQVAVAQAAEHGEPLLRELLRYLIHGLLHLGGYDDQDDTERQEMECIQEEIVIKVWQQQMMESCAK
jgi:probable rRNA maturation factor